MIEKFKDNIPQQESIEKKSIQSVLRILKETAEKFRSLEQEASEAVQYKNDTATYRQKLEERAKLLINLPNRLSMLLEEIDPEKKQRILLDTKWFATSAEDALNMDKRGLLLCGLLSHLGDWDKNDLEELISDLDK